MAAITSTAAALRTATTRVDVSAATAPSSGQVLTATGSTAATWQTPSGGGSIGTFISSGFVSGLTVTTEVLGTNTNANLSAFLLPASITVNKISFQAAVVGTSGTMKIGVYSEDGQTKLIDVTTGTISATGTVTTAVSSVALTPGIYWVCYVPVSTASITVRSFDTPATLDLTETVTSEPVLAGTVATSAGTLPSTFTPSAVSIATHNEYIYTRFDN